MEKRAQVWVNIMQQAMVRCNGDVNNLPTHVRAVVEGSNAEEFKRIWWFFLEAMAISLKLIQDSRYNSIEEQVESQKDVLGIRDRLV